MRPLPTSLAIVLWTLLQPVWPALGQQPTAPGQARPPASGRAAPTAPPAAAAPTAPGSQPQRTERITYGSWTVTCTETGAPPAKRVCTSVFPVVEQSRQQVVMTWIFGYTPEGVLTTVLQTPTGVQIPAGVELKLGPSAPRKLPYVNCDQQRCEATIAMDAAFIRDANAAASATATIIAKTGQTINLTMPLTGFDNAIAAIGQP